MSKQQTSLGELELAVLKTIWENQPCTVQQVAKILGRRRNCARTTVLTVMHRLHAKKFLKRRKADGLFQYSTTEGRSKVMTRLIGQFFDQVLDGSAVPFVTYLTEKKGLSDKQARALREIVKEIEGKEMEKQK